MDVSSDQKDQECLVAGSDVHLIRVVVENRARDILAKKSFSALEVGDMIIGSSSPYRVFEPEL